MRAFRGKLPAVARNLVGGTGVSKLWSGRASFCLSTAAQRRDPLAFLRQPSQRRTPLAASPNRLVDMFVCISTIEL
jgi:hypothetical protein